LIKKQMIFRFINTNLPIFRALSDMMSICGDGESVCTEEQKEKQFFDMYTLIFALIVTKAGATLCSRYGYNFVMFKWKMRSHFKAIQAKSEAQYANYMTKNKENKDAWESLSASEKVKLDNRNSYSI
jgi:hypothetical protein